MRRGSLSWFMGLFLSAAACTVTTVEHAAPEATDEAHPAEPGAQAAAGPNAPSSESADDDASAPPADTDAAPLADGGADADAGTTPKHQIPLPTFGQLHASSKTNDVCEFTVNGIVKGTGTFLDVSLVTGTYDVACKRTDGVVASQSAVITQSQTTNVLFDFAANGTLVAVAVNGTCAFSVNGAAKGTTSTVKLSLPAATYLVECKPSGGGATMSRTVVLKSGETAMAMFSL